MPDASERVWQRRHSNGWTTRVFEEAADLYRYHAQGHTDLKWSAKVAALSDAQESADSQVPSHDCGRECDDWRQVQGTE
jgi:hypothetical protein